MENIQSQKSYRKTYAPELKVRAVLESFQRDTTIEEVKRRYEVKGPALQRWRNEFKEKAVLIFADKRNPKSRARNKDHELGESPEELKKIIGELTVQNKILKKAQKLLS